MSDDEKPKRKLVLGPPPPPVVITTSAGAMEVGHLSLSGLIRLSKHVGKVVPGEDLGREVLKLCLFQDGTVVISDDAMGRLLDQDLEVLATAVARQNAIELIGEGSALAQLGRAALAKAEQLVEPSRSAQSELARARASQPFAALSEEIARARASQPLAALSDEVARLRASQPFAMLADTTLARIAKHTSAMDFAANALRDMRPFDGAALAAAKQHEELTKHLGAASAADELARRIAQQDEAWAKVAEPPAETLKLARSPVVDGIAETNRLARQGTEATIKSAEHLREVSDQTAVVAASMAGLSKVFLEEVIPQWARNAKDDQRTTRRALLVAIVGLFIGPLVSGWQIYSDGKDRGAEVARQEAAQLLLREQVELARRAEQDRAREAAELRRALEALNARPQQRRPAGSSGSGPPGGLPQHR